MLTLRLQYRNKKKINKVTVNYTIIKCNANTENTTNSTEQN